MEEKVFSFLEKIYSELQETRKELKSEIGKNREEIAKNREEIAKNREEIGKNRKEIAKNREEIAKNTEGIASNRDAIEKLELKIEAEISDKIRGLYDWREVINHRLDNLENKIDCLQFDVNNLTMKTISNDNRIIELNKKLKSAK